MITTDLTAFDAQLDDLDAMREVLRHRLAVGAWINWAYALPTFEEFEAQVMTLNRWHPVFEAFKRGKIVNERFVVVAARDALADSAARVAAGDQHARRTHEAIRGLLERMEAAG